MDYVSINQSFSVEDIRRIREEDDMRYRNMTAEEIARDIHAKAAEGQRILEQLRRKKNNINKTQ